ncbi:MAG: diguanylate cyclase [Oleiphilaceae bacterium]|nr:diguanylate cyclase [Oleiphilaceae bacterium]
MSTSKKSYTLAFLYALRRAAQSKLARRQAKITLIIALLLGSALSIIQITLDYHTQSKVLWQDINHALHSNQSAAGQALWRLDSDLASVLVESLIAHPLIDQAEVKTSNGVILGQAITTSNAPQNWLTLNLFGGARKITRDIGYGTEPQIGILSVGINPSQVSDSFIKRTGLVLLSGILRSCILATVLFTVFYSLVTRRIIGLSSHLHSAHSKWPEPFTEPLDYAHQDDEIGQLQHEALQLLDTTYNQYHNLINTQSELANTNVKLEQRVADRTRSLKQAMEKLAEQARTDALTGLANRGYFFEAAEVLLDQARKEGVAMAILMMDLDHFKKINDTYGHQTGDEVLVKAGQVIASQCRPEDLVARYGGEEFIALLTVPTAELASQRAEQIRSQMGQQVFEHSDLYVSFSIGIAFCDHSTSAELPQLIEQADAALYRAKHLGRNRVEQSPV